ncbi:MAG TPA: PQQ-dependent sugar dehydrogenase, partial [Polyangia bacterium]|nr:PQQ-dependent sugar dehydrogenase [Polyangia bacterium]
MASFPGIESRGVVGALVGLLLVAGGDRAEAADGGAKTLDGGAKAAPAPATKPPGPSPFTDFTTERPGKRVKITPADLPRPRATKSVDNPPRVVKRPKDAWPQAPAGFKVELYADGLAKPRLIRTAPNGDVFVAESEDGVVRVLRGMLATGKAAWSGVFAKGFKKPFGMAFYPAGGDPRWLYVANTDSVVRIPYKNGDTQARGPAETVVAELPGGGLLRGGGHWTRDIAFSRDGKRMFVSVGSRSNVDDPDKTPAEKDRATVLEFAPDGSGRRVYASGIRNAVGIAVHPSTGALWVSVNERDELGDNLVPDYITHVEEGGFYGWPWYYIGGNQDPHHAGKRPELKATTIVPDVLLQPHSASLQMLFYDGKQFPVEYSGDIFAAQHGSWNKAVRTGYSVLRVPMRDGRATGEYEVFLSGFVVDADHVWGR